MRERNNYSPEYKAKIVLELFREGKTVNQIVSETGIHATVLSRWKAKAMERMHEIFERGPSDADKLKKEFEAKEEEYQKTIGERLCISANTKTLSYSEDFSLNSYYLQAGTAF